VIQREPTADTSALRNLCPTPTTTAETMLRNLVVYNKLAEILGLDRVESPAQMHPGLRGVCIGLTTLGRWPHHLYSSVADLVESPECRAEAGGRALSRVLAVLDTLGFTDIIEGVRGDASYPK